jgi:hypothetical protein
MISIDKTYFTLPPNEIAMTDASNGYSSELTENETLRINNTIYRYKDEFLRSIMSDALYLEYVASLTTSVEKWTTFEGKLYDSNLKRSPIANYIFCGWLVENRLKLNNRATATKEKSQNSVVVDFYTIYKASWDDMAKQMQIFNLWLDEETRALYEDYDAEKYFINDGLARITELESYGF